MRKDMMILFCLASGMAAGCSKDVPEVRLSEAETSSGGTTTLTRRVFSSRAALEKFVGKLEEEISESSGGEDWIRTKSGREWPMFLEYPEPDILDDPILSVDCGALGNTKGDIGEGGSDAITRDIYRRAGYDSLVPNPAFAAAFNRRCEIQVGDTIYKVAPSGTYKMHKSSYTIFERRYAMLEQPIDESAMPLPVATDNPGEEQVVEVSPGVYRLNTFVTKGAAWKFEPPQKTIPPAYYELPGEPGPYKLANYDWTKSKIYSPGAYTWFGKLLESLFGSNSRHHAYLHDEARIRAGLYDYNYFIYRECGATVKFQRKYGLSWRQEPADELFLGWKNIVFKTTYKTPLPDALKSSPKLLAKSVQAQLPLIGSEGPTAYILGLELSSSQLDAIKGYAAGQIYDFLRGKLGSSVDLSSQLCFNVFADKCVYTILVGGFKLQRNKDRFVKIFDKGWSFSMPKVDALNLPSWENMAMNTIKGLLGSRPSSTLVHAEVGAAAHADSRSIGMRFLKK